jgi:hypothetical protein
MTRTDLDLRAACAAAWADAHSDGSRMLAAWVSPRVWFYRTPWIAKLDVPAMLLADLGDDVDILFELEVRNGRAE